MYNFIMFSLFVLVSCVCLTLLASCATYRPTPLHFETRQELVQDPCDKVIKDALNAGATSVECGGITVKQ